MYLQLTSLYNKCPRRGDCLTVQWCRWKKSSLHSLEHFFSAQTDLLNNQLSENRLF